jgi:hypothetical protein
MSKSFISPDGFIRDCSTLEQAYICHGYGKGPDPHMVVYRIHGVNHNIMFDSKHEAEAGLYKIYYAAGNKGSVNWGWALVAALAVIGVEVWLSLYPLSGG